MTSPKVKLREWMKLQLSQKTLAELDEKSRKISQNLVSFLEEKNLINLCVGAFSPIQQEPLWYKDMKDLPKLAFPRIDQKNMDFYLATFSDLKERGDYSIKEPDINHPKVTPDLLLVPGLAFTKSGGRLGRGGGHYDRYLWGFKGLTIGLCFDFQIVNDVFIQSHDKNVDFVINENGVVLGEH